jgi:hypothetical protein
VRIAVEWVRSDVGTLTGANRDRRKHDILTDTRPHTCRLLRNSELINGRLDFRLWLSSLNLIEGTEKFSQPGRRLLAIELFRARNDYWREPVRRRIIL